MASRARIAASRRAHRSRGLLAAAWLAVLCAAGRPAAGDASSRIAGNVLKIDVESREVTLLDAGKQHVVRYSDETLVKAGATAKAVSDLHKGERVVVTIDDPETQHARLIAIAGPPSATSVLAGGRKGHGSTAGVPSFAPPAPAGSVR